MLLGQIIKILSDYTNPLGYNMMDTYNAIFAGIMYADDAEYDIEATVKQIFYNNRPFNRVVSQSLYTQKTFLKLSKTIETNYLSNVGNHKSLFYDICNLLSMSNVMLKEDTEKIIAACDYTQTAELARFIAACIVCGNYNTSQMKSKKPKIGNEYGLCLDFMNLTTSASAINFKKELWDVSFRDYQTSHSYGHRFSSLSIIRELLPQGYLSNNIEAIGRTEDGHTAPLMELCLNAKRNISIIGDGGIGKTTFLQFIMKEIFYWPNMQPREFITHTPVPFFIELNKCPNHIEDWYDSTLRKTNFITRYIGQFKENHTTLNSIEKETLEQIEKEFQRIPSNGKPEYLLLLDGFNEVISGNNVRTHLSKEISALNQYPNVRIITTSRETQSAYFAKDFENIRLVGLKKEDIRQYLSNSGISEVRIGNILNCKSLVRCLQIPLYLCMFSAQKIQTCYLPETAGEILYCFFNRNSVFYNVRERLSQTQTCDLSSEQVAFILCFIIPYIGWQFETNNVFSMNQIDFEKTIQKALLLSLELFCRGNNNPFDDFNYNTNQLKQIGLSFYEEQGNSINTKIIINCIFDYLGIVYQYKTNEGDFYNRVRYAFCHHHFRDYFSAMWDVNLMMMLQCLNSTDFQQKNEELYSYSEFLDKKYWHSQKVQFISEILMEHRNRPEFNTETGNWVNPKYENDEQFVLSNMLDYARKLYKGKIETTHFIPNILAAILYGRQEISNVNLSSLNLKNCNFFNTTCSRKGRSHTLATDFSNSVLFEDNFLPTDHRNSVMEYVYSGDQCFTIDDSGIIKCWDVYSGGKEYDLHSDDPLGVSDFTSHGFIKISPDHHWMAVKAQVTREDGDYAYINLFDLTRNGNPPIKINPPNRHMILNNFNFTKDSTGLIALFDCKSVYGFNVLTSKLVYSFLTTDFLKETQLFADSLDSCIYAISAEYNAYDTDVNYIESWESEELDDYYSDDEDDYSLPVPCEILRINPKTKEIKDLYDFSGAPNTTPTVEYIQESNCFIYYNYTSNKIETYNPILNKVTPILHELNIIKSSPPSAIHSHPNNKSEIYVIYPDVIFSAIILPDGNSDILMSYTISGVEKLLSNSNQSSELEFKPHTIPTNNRFIVSDDTNTYEWDAENDYLYHKYNCAYYNCSALFANKENNKFILVHQHNGVSVFSGEPLTLLEQFCFFEQEYQIGDSCYDNSKNVLALTFAKPEHEKVKILELSTGIQKDIYSSIKSDETVTALCFDKDGNNLLISTQYVCLEYNILKNCTYKVASVGENERFVSCSYTNEGEIEIVIVEHSCSKTPSVIPYCIYYKILDNKQVHHYIKTWGYYLPKLEKDFFEYFIYQSNDLGALGSLDENEIQKYWVTQGFLLEKDTPCNKILKPKCFCYKGNRKIKLNKQFSPLDLIYVQHTAALTNQFGCGNSGYSFMYMDELKQQAILTNNCEVLFRCESLNDLTYESLKNNIDRLKSRADKNAYWDYAVPMQNGSILGCYEFYNLQIVDSVNNKLLSQIEYTPGICITGCCFDGAIMDTATKEIVLSNK